MRRLLLLPALLATALAAPPAHAWPTRTVATGGPAFALDVAGLPDGGVATLLERRRGREHVLELRTGATRRVLRRAEHGFGPGMIGVDARGRVTVVYAALPGARRGRRLFAWTAGSGSVRLDRGTSSVQVVDVDVAPDGGAVVAWFAGARVLAARRAPGDTAFTPQQALAGDTDRVGFPSVAAGDGGRAVVVAGGLTTRVERPGEPFPALQPFLTRPSGRIDGGDVALDASGRAVLVARSTVRSEEPRALERTVRAATWAPGARAPSAPVVLNRRAQTGPPVATRVGADVAVAFKEAATSRTSASVRAVVLRSDGTAVTGDRPAAGGLFGFLTAVGTPSGVRVYARAGGAVRSAHFGPQARAGAWSLVTRDRDVFSVLAAHAGGRPVAVWTTTAPFTTTRWRVRIARPAR